MKRTLLLCLIAALVAAACNRPHDEVFSTYPNGAKKLVFTVIDISSNEKERVGEKMYYDNGNLMYEKHFKGDKPTGIWQYFYPNGNLHAKGDFSRNDSIGSDWQFLNEQGENFYPGEYDSLVVIELTADHRPLSIAYCKDDEMHCYQFNENYTIHTTGTIKAGLKEGRWEFFYANGQKMLEATFIGGVENGRYNAYRENGKPYLLGFYINGKRANVWEIYDEEGNLVKRENYD